jgi:hypothetical protein
MLTGPVASGAGNPLSRPPGDRVAEQALLAGQADLDQRPGKPRPAVGGQVSAMVFPLSLMTAPARSPAAILVSPQPAEVS